MNLRKLNSMTKYPSILTYHKLGKKGSLLEERNEAFDSSDTDGTEAIVTEKVDGTNSRIIILPENISDREFILGSREDLLYAHGDLIGNPALGIVDALKDISKEIVDKLFYSSSRFFMTDDKVLTLYLETYGGKNITKASKQYTSNREVGYRLFDASVVNYYEKSSLDVPDISLWRQKGGQTFLQEKAFRELAESAGLEFTPRLYTTFLPDTIEETHEWLKRTLPKTQVALDENAGGKPEGVVVRNKDRSKIAKIRFEDYERHEKRQNK
jgi:hypothetical protein